MPNGDQQTIQRRRLPAVIALILAAIASFSLVPSGAASADTVTYNASAAILESPLSTTLSLDQFDPSLGTLERVTLRSTLEGNVDSRVTNIGLATSEFRISFTSSADLTGPPAVSLNTDAAAAETHLLAPGESVTVDLNDTDADSQTITSPAALAVFTGTGQMTFNLSALIDVNVVGPSAWRVQGKGEGLATVEVEYTYSPESTTTTAPPTTAPPTTAPPTTAPPTTAPPTTAPPTTVPPTTAPPTTAPPTTAPPTTAPPTTAPPTTAPPTTAPPTTAPPCDPYDPYGPECPPPTTVPYESQGCTPGYWKQEHHFDSWVGFSPGDSFNATFGLSNDIHPDLTLIQALDDGGGGLVALRRHAVAALLNTSSSVNYGYTASTVISDTKTAITSGNYEAIKNMFAAANEAGCPLN